MANPQVSSASAAIALFGVWSVLVVNIGSKLTMQFSMEFWDFSSATAAFFLHHAAIVGLGAVIGHYAQRFVELGHKPQTVP